MAGGAPPEGPADGATLHVDVQPLLCSNGHRILKLKENLRRHEGRLPWSRAACGLCQESIDRLEPRWKCMHNCKYIVCVACAEEYWSHAFREADGKDTAQRRRLLTAAPSLLRGTSGYARLARGADQGRDVPQALGLRLQQAFNVPEAGALSSGYVGHVGTGVTLIGAGAGLAVGGPVGAIAGLAVGAAALAARRGRPSENNDEEDGECDAIVVVEVLDKQGGCMAAARSHIVPKSRNPKWNQVLSLPSGSDTIAHCWPRIVGSVRWTSKKGKLEAASNVEPAEWDVASTTVRVTLYDRSLIHLNQSIGECTVPLVDLLNKPDSGHWMLSNASGDAVLATVAPFKPCHLEMSIVKASMPASWPAPGVARDPFAEAFAAQLYPCHVFMMTRGTRGDVQPFVALARGMAEQLGWMVTICTELPQRGFVKKNSAVSRGRIRFRPSGGDTEARMRGLGAKVLLGTKTELIQMAALSRSEAEFFSSATVFAHHLEEFQSEKPVDMIVFGFTLTGVAVLLGEHFGIPTVGFMLQPSIIPSKDPRWTAIQAISGPDGKSLMNVIEEAAFTSHESFHVLKGFAERNPFARWNLDALRALFGLAPANTWASLRDVAAPLVVPMLDSTFERPSDWWSGIQFTDFIFLRSGSGGGELEPALAAFVGAARRAGAKICLMTFSSMPVPRKVVLQCAIRMLEQCSQPLRLVYVGPREDGPVKLEARRDALVAEGRLHEAARADFGILFPQVDCFVVHGGLGTTVEALRTRRPCCVTGPLLFDQRFWGSVCAQKGVGPEPVHFDDFEASCVAFVDGALDPSDPHGWQAAARSHSWGDEAEDGVSANVACFARLREGLRPLPRRLLDSQGVVRKVMSLARRHTGQSAPPL